MLCLTQRLPFMLEQEGAAYTRDVGGWGISLLPAFNLNSAVFAALFN